VQKQPRGPFSPYFGCLIFAVIFVGGALLLGLAYYSLTSQDAAIAAFTLDAPKVLVPQLPTEVERAAFVQRVAAFRTAVGEKKAAVLEMGVAELNALIQDAPASDYGGFKEMVCFVSADAEKQELLAEVCLPLNRVKFWEGKRYAIGQAGLKPMVAEKVGLDLQLKSLTVPGKVVSQDFVDRLMLWHWLTPYTKMEGVGTVLAAISAAEVTATGVKLTVTVESATAAVEAAAAAAAEAAALAKKK
jgi:hypothetical protein